MKLNITPLQWVGIIILFNSTLIGGASQLGHLSLSPNMVQAILAVATLGNGFLGGLVSMFGSQASMVQSVQQMDSVDRIVVNAQANHALAQLAVDPEQRKVEVAPGAAMAVAKTAGTLALLFLVGGLLFTPVAHAQGKLGPIGQKIVGDIAGRAADRGSSALDSIGAALAKPFKDLADFIGSDADGAVSLATAIPSLQDGHGQQCWIEMQSFGAIVKQHPVPITFHVMQDYETLRLLGIATNRLCTNVHCTQVFADFTAMAQAASPMPLAIPSLHDLCTKVPQIAVVPPVAITPTIDGNGGAK